MKLLAVMAAGIEGCGAHTGWSMQKYFQQVAATAFATLALDEAGQ